MPLVTVVYNEILYLVVGYIIDVAYDLWTVPIV